MRSDYTWRRRRLVKEARELVSTDRLVDMGILLRVCEQDEAHGTAVMPGTAPVRVLEELRFGGMVDTRTRRIVGPSRNPVIWHCGPEQLPLIVHGEELPPRLLVFGAEGAGKTRVLSKWAILRALHFTGLSGVIGCTAPTGRRMLAAVSALKADMPKDWYRWVKSEGLFHMANGISILCVSTHRYSEEAGSPLQSYTFLACASDELQDSTTADPDIETRGRGAPGGYYRRLNTATAKDNPQWRSLRDRKRTSRLWAVRHLPGRSNPFVASAHWENLRHELSLREYRRRVLAEDVGPERMLYHSWERERNLRPLPLGARDVTAQVLRRYGKNLRLLVGYDPGQLYDVAIFLRAYLLPARKRPAWWVVGEHVMEQTTTSTFAMGLRELLRDRYELMLPDSENEVARDADMPLVIADPASDNNAEQPDEQVYRIFKRAGFLIRPAAWSKANPVKHGRIPKESRIETVCNLFCTAAGESRLHVLCDDRRQPAAPLLVDAIETQERDEGGKAETQKKNRRDVSHYTAALGYALFPLERTRLIDQQEDLGAEAA